MEINLSEDIRNILMLFIMIILPLILIIVGALSGLIHVGFYILIIFWFGMGMIFYGLLN